METLFQELKSYVWFTEADAAALRGLHLLMVPELLRIAVGLPCESSHG